jgi:predicted lipid-binding transport protein (Tim44 family)
LQNRKKVLGQIGFADTCTDRGILRRLLHQRRPEEHHRPVGNLLSGANPINRSWALGIGPLGGIGGPLLVGLLLGYHLSAASLFYAAAVPMLLAGTLVTLLGLRYGVPRQRQPVPL